MKTLEGLDQVLTEIDGAPVLRKGGDPKDVENHLRVRHVLAAHCGMWRGTDFEKLIRARMLADKFFASNGGAVNIEDADFAFLKEDALKPPQPVWPAVVMGPVCAVVQGAKELKV